MKFLRLGMYVCTLLIFSSAVFGQNPYYAVVGGSTTDSPQLTVINVNAQQVVGRLAVPQPVGGVAMTSDNTTVFATASGTPDTPANGLYVVDITDPTAPALITTIENVCGTGPGRELPAALALTADGAYVYAACLGNPNPGRTPGRYVAKVDAASLEIVTHIDMAQPGDNTPGPFGVFMHPNGQEVWITLYGSALLQRDKIVRISLANDSILGTITTGRGPTGGAFCAGGNYAYFSVNKLIGQNEIVRINLDTATIVDTINVPVGTVGIAFTSDCATAYAGGYGSLASQRDRLIRINTATRAVEPFGIGQGPFNVALSSDDNYLLVTMFAQGPPPGDTVKILDRVSLDLLGNVVVGPAPSGIALTTP